jgi:hypothetical protein
MSKVKINYWPLAILGLLGIGVVLTIWTINVASKNPTYMDSAYFADYRTVDKNINEYIANEDKFNSKYMVDTESTSLVIGQNKLDIKVFNSDMEPIENAKVSLLVTRPHTTASDIKLAMTYTEDGEYVSKSFEIKDKGRWEVIYRVEIDGLVSFKKVKLKNV